MSDESGAGTYSKVRATSVVLIKIALMRCDLGSYKSYSKSCQCELSLRACSVLVLCIVDHCLKKGGYIYFLFHGHVLTQWPLMYVACCYAFHRIQL